MVMGTTCLMSPWQITVMAVFQLETLVTVPAQIPLMPGVCLSVFNDAVSLTAMNTRNLNYSHESLRKRVFDTINRS